MVHAGTARLEEFIVAGLVDVALLPMISRSRLIALTRLAQEEMVLEPSVRARRWRTASAKELNGHPSDPRRRDAGSPTRQSAGRGIASRVDTELDDHETIRPMVQQGRRASILLHLRFIAKCARGVMQADRIMTTGVFRTLALGVAASRGPSAARDAVAGVVGECWPISTAPANCACSRHFRPPEPRPVRRPPAAEDRRLRTTGGRRDADRRFQIIATLRKRADARRSTARSRPITSMMR